MLNDQVVSIATQEKNRATELIEDFMIASNEVVARLLDARQVSSIRRVSVFDGPTRLVHERSL